MAQQRRGILRWVVVASIGAMAVVVYWSRMPSHPASPRRKTAGRQLLRDVAPIVFAKCAPCHHPGEAAPFSLLTYDDVRHRASQIVDVTQRRFMPPWLPNASCDQFVGERRLTDRELATLKQWVDAGSPSGDKSQTPAVPEFADGWQTGTPDLVLETPAYTLSSQDRDVFRNFVVPVHLESPRWVQSIELRPCNPRVTHHARLGVDSSNESTRRDAEDNQPGYPGMAWGQDPDGQLVDLGARHGCQSRNAGSRLADVSPPSLVLHTHMQPSGKPEIVQFRVGIHFAKHADQHPAMLRVGTCDIDIPAGEHRHTVKDQYVLPVDVDVQTIFPHAHSLCQSLRVVAEPPDGLQVQLIAIDHFDENWHDLYRYRQPVRLPRGTRISFRRSPTTIPTTMFATAVTRPGESPTARMPTTKWRTCICK